MYILLNILSKCRDRSDTNDKVQKCNAKDEDESRESSSNKVWEEN